MRKFNLYNSLGQKFDLNSNESFLSDPKGLGFGYSTDYAQVGAEFLEIGASINQKSVGGTLNFKTYDKYTNFVKFCQHKPLVLEYIPNTSVYRISCKIASLEKAEISEGGILRCDVAFEGYGQWYKYIYMETNPFQEGKTYNYEYNFKYTDSDSYSMIYESESVIESPVTITFIGPVKNPSWKHYVNGELVAEGKVTCEIEEGRKLKVTSVMPYAIVETDSAGNEVYDRYGNSDFSTERFLHLRLGNNVVSCAVEDGNVLAIVEGYEYYESV